MRLLELIIKDLQEEDKNIASSINLDKNEDEIMSDLESSGFLKFESKTSDDQKI